MKTTSYTESRHEYAAGTKGGAYFTQMACSGQTGAEVASGGSHAVLQQGCQLLGVRIVHDAGLAHGRQQHD